MGRFRFGSLAGMGAAWSYLLRVMTRGFLGELSLNIARLTKRTVRRLLLGARLFSPHVLSFRKGGSAKRLRAFSPTRLGRGERPSSSSSSPSSSPSSRSTNPRSRNAGPPP